MSKAMADFAYCLWQGSQEGQQRSQRLCSSIFSAMALIQSDVVFGRLHKAQRVSLRFRAAAILNINDSVFRTVDNFSSPHSPEIESEASFGNIYQSSEALLAKH